MTAQCNADMQAGEQELLELRHRQETNAEFHANMERIRKVLREAERKCETGAITRDFIDTFIDKICVTPADDGSLRLDIKIFTGDTCEKYLNKLKNGTNEAGRTGHTFKEKSPFTCVWVMLFP